MSVFFRTTLHHDKQEDFRLPVFYKQRDLLFYPAWAYALPSLVLSIPSSIAEAGMYSLITYYGIGYAPELSR
jgi:hypothetical protein